MERRRPFGPIGFCLAAALAVLGLCGAGCPSATNRGGGNGNGAENRNDNVNASANTNANANENLNANRNANSGAPRVFASAATCQECHPGQYADWSHTSHASALATLKAIGQGANGACLACHTVGFGQSGGFVDEALTPQLANVQCENCHGAAARHAEAADPALAPPTTDLSPTLCAQCHNGPHHPTFEEFSLSRHASSLTARQNLPFFSQACLQCHSEDYRQAPDDAKPTVAQAQFGITCVTCHAPHGSNQPVQLRAAIGAMCGECHTSGDVLPPGTPHHPQVDMLGGRSGVSASGTPINILNDSSHAQLLGGEACAQCHVAMHDVPMPNEGDPNVTGHTFNPFDESIDEHQAEQYTGCVLCHSEVQAGALRTSVQAEIQARMDALAPRFDPASPQYIDPGALASDVERSRLARARFDFQFVMADGSRGVHNTNYARAVLDVSDQIVAGLVDPARAGGVARPR